MPAKKLTRDDVRVQPADPTLLTREEIEPALARHHCALIDIMTCTHTRALATARAYHDLVARIEARTKRHDIGTMTCTCKECRKLRALLDPKEPTE